MIFIIFIKFLYICFVFILEIFSVAIYFLYINLRALSMPHCTNNVHCTQVMDLFPLPSVTLFKLLSNLISYCAWMLLEQENICKKKTAKLSWLFNSCHFITFLHDFFCTETRGTHSGASFLLSSISSYCPLIVRQTKA